jgi:GxxExxY protein
MNTDEVNHISERVIGCAFCVANTLGQGFLETVYEKALAHELRKAGPTVAQQHGMAVTYDGVIVGEYIVYLLVENFLLVELKYAKALNLIHSAQCLNYLKTTGLRFCLLFNFGAPRLEIRRLVAGF